MGLFLLFMGCLTFDAVLIFSGLIVLGWLAYVFSGFRGSIERLCENLRVSPDVVEASFTAGEAFETEFEVSYSLRLPLRLKFAYGGLDVDMVPVGRLRAGYSFKPDLAGEYRLNVVEAHLLDSYGLFKGVRDIPLGIQFRVYPRMFSAVLLALSYLEGFAGEMTGEIVSDRKGDGLEYADSRRYVLGDPLRTIDWKASARLGRLYVKEYFKEGAGSIHIVYDASAPDPVSADVLAASYLRSVVSFAGLGWVMGLTVLEAGEVSYSNPELHSNVAVAVALSHVLRVSQALFRELYMVLDPGRRSRLLRFMGLGFELAGVRGLGVVPYLGLLVVSALTGDTTALLEVAAAGRLSGVRPVVFEPCKPWNYAGAEEADALWRHYDKVNRSLMREGWGVAVTVEEAYDKMVALLHEVTV